jgi:uncharacterized protein YegJ (DUF2314 family)
LKPEAEMILVSEDAVERVSDELSRLKYDLKSLFKELKKENPRVAEYIQVQAQKSKNSLEIIGTGIVVYLLLKKQYELDGETCWVWMNNPGWMNYPKKMIS